MSPCTSRLVAKAVVLIFALNLTGCGNNQENKTMVPKADPEAPKLEQKTPSGGGGPKERGGGSSVKPE
jgi:hypothetical protein